ncbi:hypothetical protein FS842_010934 [Serendipita sp. 407]|nr:hypothetical protein FS842_010934 [Serendipita sp. 407]
MLLQKYPTLPNFAAYSHPSVATEHWTSCKSLSNRYANSDSGKGAGGIDVDDDDTEMTSFSSSPTSSSHSPRSAATPSVKDELLLQEVIHPFPYSYPASTGSSGSKSKLQRMNAIVSLTPEDIIPVPVAPHVAPPSACAEFDEHWARERDEESLASVDPTQLSEWESNGGLLATQAAFEGQLLFDSDLDSASEWLAPIVWKMYLRQATQCSARFRHQYDVPLETPCPAYFPKLLTRAMPRYRGGMTRAIAITHALLYLHRIKTCFHCTTVSSTSNTPFKQQKVKYQRYSSSSSSSTSASSSPNCINNNDDNAPLPEETLSKEQYQKAITNVAAQCSLFFAVGMHYASLWLLDCCPGEKTYWLVIYNPHILPP